jgi:hypothetical protein
VAKAPVIEPVIDQKGAAAGAAALVGKLLVDKAVLQRKAAQGPVAYPSDDPS